MSNEANLIPERITLAQAMKLAGVSRSTLMRNKEAFDVTEELQPVVQQQPVLMLDRDRFLAWARERGIEIPEG